MKLGTRSCLFGAHQLIIHPIFVALAWIRLYGFPWDVRIWTAFVLHDVGYFGCSDMDGESGKWHPLRGARMMGALFGQKWADFTALHSRSYAKMLGKQPSKLCYADKLATAITPDWLYLPMVCLTGEVDEYLQTTQVSNATRITGDLRVWFREICQRNIRWIDDNKDNLGTAVI